ncbi:MAG TPA: pyridoxamine 5'-phosphate oxidase family protein [Acidimicrobiia bacterium]|nr:pyridoxamine 5'-phosphate oxidase family protein [Acidimicrobiia bacterium]
MPRRDISMTGAEIDALLSSARDLQVATNGRDGYPHLTTLWYAVIEGLVTFRSFTKSQRIVNLRRDPRITVLVEAGDTYGELRGVMIQGTAELDADPARVMATYLAVLRKDEPDTTPEAVDSMFGRFRDKNTVVTVVPDRIISWDHRKSGGY